jgi:hypothetical protein
LLYTDDFGVKQNVKSEKNPTKNTKFVYSRRIEDYYRIQHILSQIVVGVFLQLASVLSDCDYPYVIFDLSIPSAAIVNMRTSLLYFALVLLFPI